MRKMIAILIAGCGLGLAAHGQGTNALKTEIGLFESQTGVVIIKGFGEIGSVTTGSAVISVRYKETTSAATGHRDFGVAVVIEGNQWRESALVDYDELNSLISGINYLGKIGPGMTTPPGFEATYTTKSGLRFIAYRNKRQGTILTYVQYNDTPRIPLSSEQWSQLANLISQAKSTLDSLGSSQ